MVASQIKPEIEYNESKKIDAEDINYTTSIYEVEILGKRVVIGIGKIKHTYTGKNILYYPVYLVSKDVVKSQIGIFELESKDFANYNDEENIIDIEKFVKDGNGLLLYKFVNKEYLELSNSDPTFYSKFVEEDESKDEEEVVEEEDIDVLSLQQKHNPLIKEKEKMEDKAIFETIENVDIPELLKEESKSEADKLKNASANQNWVQKFMKNDNYRIHNVPSDGDCFFAVICDAFKQIGKKTTIDILRNFVANSATPDLFEYYLALYNQFIIEIKENNDIINKIAEKIKDFKHRQQKAESKTDKETLLKNIEQMVKDKNKYKKYIIIAEESIKPYLFMENVKSLDEMREKMKRSSYWADEFAISKLEEKLNIKMIILSEANFKNGSEDTVMVCASGISNAIPNPTPEFYIMTSFTENHYNLISYKDKKIFKFSEIPYYIKTLIVNKCIEKNAGVFHSITDFRSFQSKFGIDPVLNSYSAEPLVNSEIYDDTIHFMFYDKSADADPGKGSGEKIGKTDLLEFKDLQLSANWRRMLDDEYVAPFTFDGKQWQTVEHYYQAAKFKKGHPEFYATFSLDDDKSDIANNVKKAKAVGGKTGRFDKQLFRPKDVKLDPDFYGGRDRIERANALTAKFETPELKKLLLDTKKAKLLHFVRGSEPEVDMPMMELRAKMKPAL